ncbi:helix-turn-helix domain-containing protein [Pseudoxanthomonas sp. SL93]|jgi:AraC family transcriptional regulator|uniref:helix-turn-helix domain-containing protein n=1 Tax=Pseudoxanthomonas sp. SL93 TaxID=2995142 RepID=UPI00226FFA7A|nr:helix-turn-helix domain-containing protein [Pseudoxanthomonas sp. SL93]WAC62920.1 helix-turn-helix domain-containing protein [Pseudoxanthomonas sp. SL93]
MEQTLWGDRGQLVKLEPSESNDQTGCVAVSRLGNAQVGAELFSVWVQLRGASWVEAKEGRFRLRRGHWIALEKDSKPLVQTDRYGLCLGVTLSMEGLRAMARFADSPLYAGRGRLNRRDALTLVRLWREAGRRAQDGADISALRPLLLHLAGVQQEFSEFIQRCPGRSRNRKRQVFGRLQRARLYLEGNCDRVVRISELAELTSFSSWYFSRTFYSLYDESPQAAAARMRLEHAAELLRNTSMMVGEVAAASGFDNCCSFARAFRARFGTSASRYRSSLVPSRTDSAKSSAAARKAVTRTGT